MEDHDIINKTSLLEHLITRSEESILQANQKLYNKMMVYGLFFVISFGLIIFISSVYFNIHFFQQNVKPTLKDIKTMLNEIEPMLKNSVDKLDEKSKPSILCNSYFFNEACKKFLLADNEEIERLTKKFKKLETDDETTDVKTDDETTDVETDDEIGASLLEDINYLILDTVDRFLEHIYRFPMTMRVRESMVLKIFVQDKDILILLKEFFKSDMWTYIKDKDYLKTSIFYDDTLNKFGSEVKIINKN